MRLIDAEHLIKKAEKEKKDGLLEDDELETIYYELSDEPTVDAIPIDYIKDTIKWAEKNGSNEYAYYLYHLLSVWAERKEE